MTPTANRVVRAAGGVVWRSIAGDTEIALVSRPRYGDLTLPKGKLERGEPSLLAAVREVREETGVDAVPQVRLPSIQYLTGEPGVEKTVEFWSMRTLTDHGRQPDNEVSEVHWMRVPEAIPVLTYAHDRGVVAAFAALPPVVREVLLVRHAQAVPRAQWHGTDAERPLDVAGQRQAQRLAALLRVFAPERVVSASAQRCRQTVAPLGLPVDVDARLDESLPSGLDGASQALLALGAGSGPTVACTQGKVITPLLGALRPANATVATEYQTAKGDTWLLAVAGDRVVAADHLSAD